MFLPQPKVTPLASGINLSGKTAIVTGANAGIGYAIAHQLLALNLSTLVMAVRTTSKGEQAKAKIIADPFVRSHNPKADIRIMKLDMDSYDSVKQFSSKVKSELRQLDILVLNAGIMLLNLEISASGHDRTTQVNYHSNVLLTFELLPFLEVTADKTGVPSRLTWVGSRNIYMNTLEKKAPVKPGESVIEHFDKKENFFPLQHYNDAKLLTTMHLYEIAKYVPRNKVIINSVCPGMVDTNMSNVLPFPLRQIIAFVKLIVARTPEEAGWIIVHAIAVLGPESHGRLYGDKTVEP